MLIMLSMSAVVCVSDCPFAYLKKLHTAKLHQIFVHVDLAVVCSFSSGVAISYVLLVILKGHIIILGLP